MSTKEANYVTPLDMLGELREDNMRFVASLRETHGVCDEHGDVATASLIENWIDEAEQRIWFLFEAGRRGEAPQRREDKSLDFREPQVMNNGIMRT